MLWTITPDDMKQTEQLVMQSTFITGEMLMQCAANSVKQTVMLHLPQGKCLWCVCGTGNNGGDGIACARMLLSENPEAECELWLLHGNLSVDAQRELDRLLAAFGQSSRLHLVRLNGAECPPIPENIGCIVDAMFGTGLCRPLAGEAKLLCEAINALAQDVPVVAVDIPSGLNGATGEILGCAVHAWYTITFHRPKPGLYLQSGPDYAGQIRVCDIGLNAPIAKPFDAAQGLAVLERSDLRHLLPKRRATLHKGSCGKVLLWVGNEGMAGAAAVCAEAALRSGAGLVTVACPEKILAIVQTLCPCALAIPLQEESNAAWEKLRSAMEKADAIALGCGIGQSAETKSLLQKALSWLNEHTVPAVLDADALNLLADMDAHQPNDRLFFTPHPAEAARLLHCTVAAVLQNPQEAAQTLHRIYGGGVILKSARSLLCAGDQLALNPFGTPAMAKGGSGDALTGVLAALLAGRVSGLYHMTDVELLQVACALHALAGERAAMEYGERGLLSTDLCRFLGLDYSEPKAEPVILRKAETLPDTTCTLIVEHPIRSRVGENGVPCPMNFGYVQQLLNAENRWQDAVLIGADAPLEWCDARLHSVLHQGTKSLYLLTCDSKEPDARECDAAFAFWKTYLLPGNENKA